ncbi:hypothetical protein GGD65_000670 [Bradyrhizobium sp. CIR18]|uniref:hypothetical protein n=1 Tax=Bradyrhizobium sp. CIR18 TaxID=2663839 RepID=UPI0016066540|nr:hypothetical protein [Bradyrhizobium sp. CIR18]MBB4359672.1 hypothetical protein [Bradyrhizobium sp. CIR18]
MNETFSNRPEDFLNKGLRAAVGLLPVVGNPLVEFLAFAIGDPAQERRDDFIRGIFEQATQLQVAFDQLRAENLRVNAQFQATFLDAVRLAATSATADRKTILQNAVLNSAIASLDESLRLKLVDVLARMTPAHVRLLQAIASRPGPLEDFVVDDDQSAFEFKHALLTDMYSTFLIRNNQSMIGERTIQEQTASAHVRLTDLGQRFLEFVRAPQTPT